MEATKSLAAAVLVCDPSGATDTLLSIEAPHTVSRSFIEANHALAAGGRWAAFVLATHSSASESLDWLARVREGWPDVPALVVAARVAARDLRRALELDARLCPEPVTRSALGGFFRSALRRLERPTPTAPPTRWLRGVEPRDTPHTGLVRSVCERAIDRFGLTCAESRLLAAHVNELPRGDAADRLGISESTYDKHASAIRRKSGRSPLQLAIHLLRLEAESLARMPLPGDAAESLTHRAEARASRSAHA